MFPNVKVIWDNCGETRIGCLKSKGTPGLVPYWSVPLLCKMFLTARLFVSHSEAIAPLNITYLINTPKELSFAIDEIFPSFASFITPKHKRCKKIPTKPAQIPAMMHTDEPIPQ